MTFETPRCTVCGANLYVDPSIEVTTCEYCKAVVAFVNRPVVKSIYFDVENGTLKKCIGDDIRDQNSVVIPNTVHEIAPYAFQGHRMCIEKVVLPETITKIGEWAFDENYFKYINIPKKVSVINNGTFHRCTELQEINIPYGVTHIGISAFEACLSLKNVIIPNTVTTIGKYAFASCINLEYIQIPSSVVSIGKDCFQCCEAKIEYL
jgi:hypothetical protein